MNMNDFQIQNYNDQIHREQVIGLWKEIFGYTTTRNAPALVIDKKLAIDDGLFFVGIRNGEVIGTLMAGYDGHRGWIYSLAVLSIYQRQGIGSALLCHAERKLSALGCVKINLQVFEGNDAVDKFYIPNGYTIEKRISMGKELKENIV